MYQLKVLWGKFDHVYWKRLNLGYGFNFDSNANNFAYGFAGGLGSGCSYYAHLTTDGWYKVNDILI